MPARLGRWTERLQTWGFLTRARVNTRLKRWAKKSEAWGFFTFVRVVEFLAVLIALIGFFNELGYRHEERMARAWQLLTTPAPGNSGKGEALEYLKDRNILLQGIDLTPPFLVEKWKNTPKEKRKLKKEGCSQWTYLRNVKLPKACLPDAVLVCADLRGANLQGARLAFADLQGAWFDKANLRGTNLKKADLHSARLQDANLEQADLRGIKGIGCCELKQAKNWETAYRDKKLKCGAKIPSPPSSVSPCPPCCP